MATPQVIGRDPRSLRNRPTPIGGITGPQPFLRTQGNQNRSIQIPQTVTGSGPQLGYSGIGPVINGVSSLRDFIGGVQPQQRGGGGGGGFSGFGRGSSSSGSRSSRQPTSYVGPNGLRYKLDPSTGQPMTDSSGRAVPVRGLSKFNSRGLADLIANNAVDEKGNFLRPNQWQRLQDRTNAMLGAANLDSTLTPTIQQPQLPAQDGIEPLYDPYGLSNPNSALASLDLEGFAGAAMHGKKHAKGDKTYLVNEEGTEAFIPDGGAPMLIPGPMRLFKPPTDGRIIPHKKTMEMMGAEPRANGGRVQAPRALTSRPQQYMQTPMGRFAIGNKAANPYALKWAQGQQMSGRPIDSPTFNELLEEGKSLGLDMSQAPRNRAGLEAYIRMGSQRKSAYDSARGAVASKKREQEAERKAREDLSVTERLFAIDGPLAGQEIVTIKENNPWGAIGYAGTLPRPAGQVGMFANDQGRMLPWSVPKGSWEETWKVDNLISDDWEANTRPFLNAGVTLEELIGDAVFDANSRR